MARKQKETIKKTAQNNNKKEQFLIFLFLLTKKSIFFFISLQKFDFQSFKTHVIWGKFSYLNIFCPVTSAFQWDSCQTTISCPLARFPTCTLIWDHLCCLVLDHRFDNEGQPLSWSLRLLRGPFLIDCLARIWSAEMNGYSCCSHLTVPLSPGYCQTVPGDIPSYSVIHTGDLLAQSVTLCRFMPSSTNPSPGSRESTGDCSNMAPVLEGKFGERQRAPELASGAGSKELPC